MRGAAARRRQYTFVARTVQEENFRALPTPHTVLTLLHVIITCFSTSRNFWPARFWGETKRQKTLCRTGWRVWRRLFAM
jgi:hypothetical protein